MNRAFLTRLPRIGSLAALVLVGAAIAAPGLANAGVISFSFANQSPAVINGATGGSGTVDVVITETGTPDTLFQFQVEAFLTNHGGSNIALNAALETGAPVPPGSAGGYAGGTNGYVFGQNSYNNSAAVSGGGQIGVNSSTDIGSSDNDVTAGTLLGTTSYGLMQLEFTVPAGTAAGSYTLSFNQDDPNTDGSADYVDIISKADGNPVSPALAPNGAIVVTPEPASVLMMIIGAVGLIGVGVRRARRA